MQREFRFNHIGNARLGLQTDPNVDLAQLIATLEAKINNDTLLPIA